jgi:catechol 2,3-dioxygenase-like lactoylglutathione lyase family enzyme
MIKGFSHFSFTVSSAEASAAWYVEHLRFELVRRQRQDNDYTREFVGVPGAVLEVALLRLPSGTGGDGALLELVEYVQPAGVGNQPAPGDVGFAHLSMEVDDIHGEFERLSEQGVSFRSPPVAITAGMNEGGYVCYLVDPDGNGLEFFELPRPPAG